MKVLFINSVCNGSTGHIVQDLALKYIKDGHECAIAYGRGKPADSINCYKIGNDFSVKFHGLMNRMFDSQGLYSKKDTKRFVEWISDYKPDLIWLHNIHGYYLNYPILFDYLKKSGVKVRWTLHDCWSFTGHCAYFDYAGCNKWKTGCEKCHSIGDYPRSYCDKSKRNFELKKKYFTSLPIEQLSFVTPSNWLASLVKESFLSKYNVEVVNNKIDTSIFKPIPSDVKERYGIGDKKVILGVASVWDRRKGLDDFVKLSKMISEEYKIVLIGLKKKQISSLPSDVLGIERTESQKELAEWYSASYCFLNLTYEDNYPTTNLEAQACGCPCVTYNTGGSPESVSREFVIERGDLGSLNKIFDLLRQNNKI